MLSRGINVEDFSPLVIIYQSHEVPDFCTVNVVSQYANGTAHIGNFNTKTGKCEGKSDIRRVLKSHLTPIVQSAILALTATTGTVRLAS